MKTVALAIVDGNPMPVDLGDPIGTTRIKRCALFLWNFDDFAEHFAARGLIEADFGIEFSNRVQQSCHPQRGYVACKDWLAPRRLHKTLGSKVIDLIRLAIFKSACEAG